VTDGTVPDVLAHIPDGFGELLSSVSFFPDEVQREPKGSLPADAGQAGEGFHSLFYQFGRKIHCRSGRCVLPPPFRRSILAKPTLSLFVLKRSSGFCEKPKPESSPFTSLKKRNYCIFANFRDSAATACKARATESQIKNQETPNTWQK
jgi:hypothetical protein